MEWQITGKNIEVNDAVHRYVEDKVGKLAKHLPELIQAQVEITQEKTKSPEHRFVVQATLNSNGTFLRSQARAQELFLAVDEVARILDRQIERYKGKSYSKSRGVTQRKALAEAAAMLEPEAPSKIVKVKRFPIRAMSLDDATRQMELLDHDFFIFWNSAENRVNLLYRRQDGDFGLIVPELP